MGKGPEVKRISPLGKTKSGSDGWGWSIKMKWQEMRMHRRGGDRKEAGVPCYGGWISPEGNTGSP